jgi:hypothetical protein
MKFKPGDATDSEQCTALKHEFLRCEDPFKDFETYGTLMILKGYFPENFPAEFALNVLNGYANMSMRTPRWLFTNNNVHVLTKKIQKTKKPFCRKAFEASAQEIGYFRLIDLQQFRCFDLSQPSLINNLGNTHSQFSFCYALFRV